MKAQMITLAAVVLTANMGVAGMFKGKAPIPTCGIKTVSYKFVGQPGTPFRFDGATYSIPPKGSIELVASRNSAYEANGRALPLDVWPMDQFGTRTVPVASTESPK